MAHRYSCVSILSASSFIQLIAVFIFSIQLSTSRDSLSLLSGSLVVVKHLMTSPLKLCGVGRLRRDVAHFFPSHGQDISITVSYRSSKQS